MYDTTQKTEGDPVTPQPESTATKETKSAQPKAGAKARLVRSADGVFTSGERDLRVDMLRGIFLVLMMVDYLPRHPLQRFTTQTFGLVSAAEGFVFISGLVSAWVYGRILVKQGEAAVVKRAWRRARDIYFTHVFLYTLALLGGLWGGWQVAHGMGFWTAWWRGSMMIYQPQLFGILPMYTVFLLLLPLLLQQMEKGRAWLVCGISILFWLSAQWGAGSAAHSPNWLHQGSFNIVAWQLLFVAGAYFGYRRVQGLDSPIRASRGLLVFCAMVMASLFVLRHQGFFFKSHSFIDLEAALGPWRSSNHPLRLLNFAACAYILWYIPRSVDKGLQGMPVFRFLRYLSRHSLQVFAWSVVVSYVAYSFAGSWAALSPVWQTMLAIATVLSLAIPAWTHERWKRIIASKGAQQNTRVARAA